MRPKIKSQLELDFSPSSLKVTNEYYDKYSKISQVLDNNPGIVEAVHRDLAKMFGGRKKGKGGRDCLYASETVLRMVIAKQIEGLDYRDAVVRMDDSPFLRKFVKIYNGKMMDFTTLCKMFKAIGKQAWKKINGLLTEYALEAGKISGEQLRRDSTVYEANIHYPTDSFLLWDTYRVLARFLEKVRDIDPDLVGDRRLRTKDVKRTYTKISRQASKKKAQKGLKASYIELMRHVDKILIWTEEVCEAIRCTRTDYTWDVDVCLLGLANEYERYIPLGLQVMNQTIRRALNEEHVPNDEKIFSIFEPHVELIIRGKAGKNIEFGHVVNLQQVSGKFITGYDVFERKPVEHQLVDPTLERHREVFGDYPEVYADDKGAYESMDKLYELEEKISVVSIGKKGKRNAEEEAREHTPAFKLAQKFRAGIEGSISFLKRSLGLGKCMFRSFRTFQSSVGSIVFAHNLLVLIRI